MTYAERLLDALSTGWVARELGVTRSAIAEWRRGRFPEKRQRELVRQVAQLLPRGTRRALAPDWASALEAQVRQENEDTRLLIAAALAAVGGDRAAAAVQEQLRQQLGASPREPGHR